MTADDIAALVLKDMLPVLNNWQLSRLESALRSALVNVQIVDGPASSAPPSEENGRLTKAFLAAKSVEGCSKRTISYYESTLTKALASIGEHVSLITTNDLRKYLHDYPCANGAGHQTVDNVRRVLSSFFSWLEDEDHIG